ncbi:MAG: glycoside hydrolase family 38 C-terminal domain-containing protein [Phycisphaerales bacterium]
MKRSIHLVCNAHLDPVWLWEWQEGAAEALATFRIAADFCEQFENFIFNHNEVILYKWVQEYDPDLFKRIQRLVKAGKWHIMGGWYLQPDCNMPSGESFIRQILLGRDYFRKYFNVQPSTAINLDPFGHSRGLVQILAKSGFDSYIFGRPQKEFIELPSEDFIWKGFDGSEIMARRFCGWYSTPLGHAAQVIEQRIKLCENPSCSVILWGVGNHGGGPSRIDLKQISELIKKRTDLNICHSTPEAYFKQLASQKSDLPKFEDDLNPWGIGCYTSMAKVKQKHRQLENELYMTEKMAACAAMNSKMDYPAKDFQEAECDLMFAEFHDALPGTSIQPAEDATVRNIDHALEILSRIKARALFACSSEQKPARDGHIPVFVYNPHPYEINHIVECEFNIQDFNRSGNFTMIALKKNGKLLDLQLEQELSSMAVDWRKRVAFNASLKPGLNRFDCETFAVAKKPQININVNKKTITFSNPRLKCTINTQTGLIDSYSADGTEFIKSGAFEPIVLKDNPDAWVMKDVKFQDIAGKFKLMTPQKATEFTSVQKDLGPIRAIEDGPVRTIIEVLFNYRDSFIVVHYKLPKTGTEIEIEYRVFWNQKDELLKISVPLKKYFTKYVGQSAYGVTELPNNGNEAVAQKWVAAVAEQKQLMFSCINDGTYGSDFNDSTMRLSLMRSPAYSGHPIDDKPIIPQDRFTPRMDQGERVFRFWFNAGKLDMRQKAIDREALTKNEKPFALSFFPSGKGRQILPAAILSDEAITVNAIKQAIDNKDWIIRLFEPTGKKRSTVLKLPALGMKIPLSFSPFEIKTLRINYKTKRFFETNLLEQKM